MLIPSAPGWSSRDPCGTPSEPCTTWPLGECFSPFQSSIWPSSSSGGGRSQLRVSMKMYSTQTKSNASQTIIASQRPQRKWKEETKGKQPLHDQDHLHRMATRGFHTENQTASKLIFESQSIRLFVPYYLILRVFNDHVMDFFAIFVEKFCIFSDIWFGRFSRESFLHASTWSLGKRKSWSFSEIISVPKNKMLFNQLFNWNRCWL